MKLSKIPLVLTLAMAGLFSMSQARADLASSYLFTDGEGYAAFTMGSGLGASSFANTTMTGDLGVGSSGQTLNFNSTDAFSGNVYLYPTGTTVNGSPTFSNGHGLVNGQASKLNAEESNFYAANTSLSNLGATANYTAVGNRSFTTGSKNLNLTGGSTLTLTQTGSGVQQSVLDLTTLTLANSTLAVVGNGNANSSFVFNITSTFNMNGSHVTLSGGLTAGNVIFNLVGASPGGENTSSYFMLLNSTVNGEILAPYRTIAISGSTLNGDAIGERIVSSNGSVINETPASQ